MFIVLVISSNYIYNIDNMLKKLYNILSTEKDYMLKGAKILLISNDYIKKAISKYDKIITDYIDIVYPINNLLIKLQEYHLNKHKDIIYYIHNIEERYSEEDFNFLDYFRHNYMKLYINGIKQ